MKRAMTLVVLTAVVVCASATAFAQVNVTATVGTPSASYATLKLAFDAINAGTQGGGRDDSGHAEQQRHRFGQLRFRADPALERRCLGFRQSNDGIRRDPAERRRQRHDRR
jgi:hypothetical protein